MIVSVNKTRDTKWKTSVLFKATCLLFSFILCLVSVLQSLTKNNKMFLSRFPRSLWCVIPCYILAPHHQLLIYLDKWSAIKETFVCLHLYKRDLFAQVCLLLMSLCSLIPSSLSLLTFRCISEPFVPAGDHLWSGALQRLPVCLMEVVLGATKWPFSPRCPQGGSLPGRRPTARSHRGKVVRVTFRSTFNLCFLSVTWIKDS